MTTTFPWQETDEFFAVLQDFYDALASDCLVIRGWFNPDPSYIFQVKLEWGTPEGRERLVGLLDEEFLNELLTHEVHWSGKGVTKHPEFYRAPDAARLTLAQRLDVVLVKYGPPEEPRHEDWYAQFEYGYD